MLQVRDDMGEDVPYTSALLPIYSVVWRLSSFLRYSAECHWHHDLEFIVVLEGEMISYVNDHVYPFTIFGICFSRIRYIAWNVKKTIIGNWYRIYGGG
jgi:hypothetical protein